MKAKIMLIPLSVVLMFIPASVADADTMVGGLGHGDGIDVIYSSNGPDGLGILYFTLQDPPAKSVQLILTSVSDSRDPWLIQPAKEFELALRPLMMETYTVLLIMLETGATVAECQLEVGTTAVMSFESSGGTGRMSPVTVDLGSGYTLPECAFGAPAGKHFAGWTLNYAPSEIHSPGDVIKVQGSAVVTALWEDDIYTISYSSGDGTGSMPSMQAVYGQELLLPDCTFDAPEGKSFTGWAVDGRSYGSGEVYVVQGDTEIIAQWGSDDPGYIWIAGVSVLLIAVGLIAIAIYQRRRQ